MTENQKHTNQKAALILAGIIMVLPFGLNLAEVSASPYLATISATLSAGLAITALVSYARYR